MHESSFQHSFIFLFRRSLRMCVGGGSSSRRADWVSRQGSMTCKWGREGGHGGEGIDSRLSINHYVYHMQGGLAPVEEDHCSFSAGNKLLLLSPSPPISPFVFRRDLASAALLCSGTRVKRTKQMDPVDLALAAISRP